MLSMRSPLSVLVVAVAVTTAITADAATKLNDTLDRHVRALAPEEPLIPDKLPPGPHWHDISLFFRDEDTDRLVHTLKNESNYLARVTPRVCVLGFDHVYSQVFPAGVNYHYHANTCYVTSVAKAGMCKGGPDAHVYCRWRNIRMFQHIGTTKFTQVTRIEDTDNDSPPIDIDDLFTGPRDPRLKMQSGSRPNVHDNRESVLDVGPSAPGSSHSAKGETEATFESPVMEFTSSYSSGAAATTRPQCLVCCSSAVFAAWIVALQY